MQMYHRHKGEFSTLAQSIKDLGALTAQGHFSHILVALGIEWVTFWSQGWFPNLQPMTAPNTDYIYKAEC